MDVITTTSATSFLTGTMLKVINAVNKCCISARVQIASRGLHVRANICRSDSRGGRHAQGAGFGALPAAHPQQCGAHRAGASRLRPGRWLRSGPYALVANGLRWHVRGFDRKHGEFRDFVLTRIKAAVVLEGSKLSEAELETQDRQWNRFVELELVPHPRIDHSEAIELDYGMTGGVLKVEIRAATAGYLLRQWHVDCSTEHSLMGFEYQLWLRNSQALYGVTNLSIAPGRTS